MSVFSGQQAKVSSSDTHSSCLRAAYPMISKDASTTDLPSEHEYTPDNYCRYLHTEFLMPIGGGLTKSTVTVHKHSSYGHPVGLTNNNPLLDSREYEFYYHDGSINKYTSNVIAEASFTGRQIRTFNCVTG
jgi:hypothetical protein